MISFLLVRNLSAIHFHGKLFFQRLRQDSAILCGKQDPNIPGVFESVPQSRCFYGYFCFCSRQQQSSMILSVR